MTYWRPVRTAAKGRWFGRSRAEIAAEIAPTGRIVACPPIVREHDQIEYTVHVHEPHVPLHLDIVAETAEFVVVNKPSGIPTHPTVNYLQNTVTERLKASYGSLRPCYRLDRLTSGVLVLAKTAEALDRFVGADRAKVYYARVTPGAPWMHPTVLDAPIVTYNAKHGYDAFLCEFKRAKPAQTRVQVIHTSPHADIVRCEPFTGRTHQIRKHLALAGFPVANDPVYNDGLFRALCEDPSADNFANVYNDYDRRRQEKLTGYTCEECGTELYESTYEELDLHCAVYRVGETTFRAPVSWLPSEFMR